MFGQCGCSLSVLVADHRRPMTGRDSQCQACPVNALRIDMKRGSSSAVGRVTGSLLCVAPLPRQRYNRPPRSTSHCARRLPAIHRSTSPTSRILHPPRSQRPPSPPSTRAGSRAVALFVSPTRTRSRPVCSPQETPPEKQLRGLDGTAVLETAVTGYTIARGRPKCEAQA